MFTRRYVKHSKLLPRHAFVMSSNVETSLAISLVVRDFSTALRSARNDKVEQGVFVKE